MSGRRKRRAAGKASAPAETSTTTSNTTQRPKSSEANVSGAELGHGPIRQIPISEIRPSPENEKLYRPVRTDDPEIIELADSIKERGVLEPLVVTVDGFILSGHRRYVAAKMAGLILLPCRVNQLRRGDDPDEFLRLLREHNRQREKSFDEKLREEVVTVNPDAAYQSLIEHRTKVAVVKVDSFVIGNAKRRAAISNAKQQFLNAIMAVVEAFKKFWPLSDRQIHYPLLNDPPLRHASKPNSSYKNDRASYKSLVDLLTRARLAGLIPMEAIGDETRPVTIWKTWPDIRGFIRSECDGMFKGYWRDLMQSQPNHTELLVEKNTVASIAREVAMQYCIPMTSGRGFCSLPPRHAMAKRFKSSGKEKLIVLIASDFDPDGEEIAHSFARSMRDDFGIANVYPVKIALTAEQVRRFSLPPNMVAKEKSSNFKKFVARYGRNVFELEAVPPHTLQTLIREAIDAVIDIPLFNVELEREKQDAVELEGVRQRVVTSIQRRKSA
jgi:hypothetical protein